MITLFFYSIIASIVLFIIHLIICKISGSTLFMFKSILLYIIFSILTFYNFLGLIEHFIFLFFVGCIWNSYLIFLINLQNSISFRIMRELSNSDKIELSSLEIFYSSDNILDDRLDDMLKNDFISIDSGIIKPTSKGKIYAEFISKFRKIFGIQVYG